ncbi:PrsW family glutamic-type intramembrane protease [Leptospira ilyithenensis]|uniref:PrsW family intramembrane metalloprotease n=1 Tax=Leptospira ilyithenensis TaxID=2484901 RepID=A0A4V3JX18_9LEPT|nr:PrsW family glutamic-type intramembrane protease [Leptospira ilyithenensis]TGN10471.1 PrsW family intramembrane metalloprotease [Leptospira ilyithenensis]
MKEIELTLLDYLIGSLSVLPWGIVLWKSFPKKLSRNAQIGIVMALLLGWVSTVLILWLHPVIWPQTDFVTKKKVSMLTQTAHLAFIQAGMMEESFKILFILLLSFALSFDFKTKSFLPESALFAGFVAMGFSFIENTHYIVREVSERKLDIFLARTIHSSNIHLLINLCFGMFLLKSNSKEVGEKVRYLFFAFLLAVLQHGVVDFLLIPGASFGQWVASAMFVGIWVWVVRDWRVYVTAYLLDKKTLIPASEYSSQST